MFAGKPIVGIVGGIGSGKSFVAGLFAELGCAVIDSDAQVRVAYTEQAVRDTIRQWWGDAVFNPDGSINRRAIAARIFTDPSERRRLEGLIHPLVHAARAREMEGLAKNAQVLAFVWNTPLLLEAGLQNECDALIYVDSPLELRLQRVKATRGWDAAELARRENLQSPLDTKREISDYVVKNTASAGDTRRQVQNVLSRILARRS